MYTTVKSERGLNVGLSEQEKAVLVRLQKKAEEPDPAPVSRAVTASIDLGDPKQVALAIKHGFLTSDDVEDLDADPSDKEDEDADETPKRRGYFGDS